ncbi:enterochelin esterase domain-containing protein [Corynebacterium variabile]|uniref:enterochelin esterase domain-containing protein n=1 Tax=Corynebacterium variabile TaxID=1727 RepID=UPI0028AEDF12|nr:enterochelin esterase domain-containing protein [Corynebacterium variabile]
MLITFTWTAPTDMPAVDRVHLHVTGVHDHHDPDFHRMDRVGDRWESTVEVPEDLVASYRIMPVTGELAAQVDAEPDSRVRWMTVVGQTVPHVLDHPAWHPAAWSEGFGEASGRLVMSEAPEQAGWDSADSPGWEETPLDGRSLWTADLPDADYVLVLSDGRNWAAPSCPPRCVVFTLQDACPGPASSRWTLMQDAMSCSPAPRSTGNSSPTG